MSGGIDSAACAAFLAKQGIEVSAVFVDHGQTAASSELQAVKAMSNELGIEFRQLTLSGAGLFGAGELVGRNAFLILAALFATRGQSGMIAIGLHAGTPYYDCSPAFVESMNRIVAEHTDSTVQVVAPFIAWSKRSVYEYFLSAGLSVSKTYSCEVGGVTACGLCASCLDRRALQC
jgi:7-cyano-7-deazaguanine synthase